MDFIWDIGIFVIVLAELVFFHELGHFLAAKACGVYCDRFSIGMPPRLFGFRWGETDYCLGALPIGGYVKMAGQEDMPQEEEQREKEYGHVPPERWLNNRPRWQRMIVFAAGPFMNLVLGIALYAIVAGMGAEVPLVKLDNRIGAIAPDSPAANAPMYRLTGSPSSVDIGAEPDAVGWQTGDHIVSIDGEPVQNIQDVLFASVLSGQSKLDVIIERESPDGLVTRYYSPVRPKKLEPDAEHPRVGVTSYETALVGHVLDDTPAQRAGIEPGDIIVRANGKNVDMTTFNELIADYPPGEPLQLELRRDGEEVAVTVSPERVGSFAGVSFWPPLNWLAHAERDAPLEVVTSENGLLERTGLRAGAEILRIAGEDAAPRILWRLYKAGPDQPVKVTVASGGDGGGEELQATPEDLLQAVTEYDIHEPPSLLYVSSDVTEETGLQRKDVIASINREPATPEVLRRIMEENLEGVYDVRVERPAILFGLLQRSDQFDTKLALAPRSVIGVAWDSMRVVHRVPPLQVLPEAFRRSYQALERTVRTLAMLATGGLSPKDLGGPVMIYQITTDAAKLGVSWLLEITAFISINLCVFNLLPLPVLDGGHLVLLSVEGVRRKPLDPRWVERFQKVGVVLIIGLFLFITFNDVKRLVSGMLP